MSQSFAVVIGLYIAYFFSFKVEVHGYLRYTLNPSKCHSFWRSNSGNIGCRIYIAVCYTKKAKDVKRL